MYSPRDGIRITSAIVALLLLARSVPALSQSSASAAASPSIAFPQVTGIPVPLQSISGRFSSLNPLGRHSCPYKSVSGRVVSSRLVMVKEMDCGRWGHDNALVNIQFSNPADAAQMIPGRQVVVTGHFNRAEEDREPTIVAEFLIAEKAAILAGDPADPSARPTPPFTSYMICQPPELDALVQRLGSELCVQNTLLANLTVSGAALETAARTPSQASPEDMVAGDGNAISCRLEGGVSDRHLSAIACARNSYWAWYKALHDPQFSMPAPP